MFSGCLISLYIKMAVGKECLGLAENFEEMKDELTVNPLLSPPRGGGIFMSSPFEWGLNGDGGGGFLIFERGPGA